VQPRQLRVQFPGDGDAVGDCRLPVIGAIGRDENALDHAEPSFSRKKAARVPFPAPQAKCRRSRFRLFDAGRDDTDETKDILALVDHAVFLAGGKKEGVPFPEGGFLPLLVADGPFTGEDEDLVFPGVGVIRARQAGSTSKTRMMKFSAPSSGPMTTRFLTPGIGSVAGQSR